MIQAGGGDTRRTPALHMKSEEKVKLAAANIVVDKARFLLLNPSSEGRCQVGGTASLSITTTIALTLPNVALLSSLLSFLSSLFALHSFILITTSSLSSYIIIVNSNH